MSKTFKLICAGLLAGVVALQIQFYNRLTTCDETLGMAILESIHKHPEEWTYKNVFLENKARDMEIHEDSLDIVLPFMEPVSTIGCRHLISEAAIPIQERTYRDEQAEKAAQLMDKAASLRGPVSTPENQ